METARNRSAVSVADKASAMRDTAAELFKEGTGFSAYEYLGCHPKHDGDGHKYTFRVWAPRAQSVELVGDFNDWKPVCPMARDAETGIWEYELASSASLDGCNYKYRITGKNGVHLKADPYARANETLRGTASKIYEEKSFDWSDGLWLKRRKKTVIGDGKQEFFSAPLNIYEMHLGSWRTRDGRSTKDGDSYLTYREIADDLSEYIREMGYTHVELLPIMEHPFDGSWGYQTCGYYSPTARYGSPEDFKYFVNKLHSVGIGVILDIVPAQFPKDEHGLFEFDGEPLYEYADAERRENEALGTGLFDIGKKEVACFLISNALFWLREYHADGLKCDSETMLTANASDASSFFKKLNTAVFGEFPDVIMAVEGSYGEGRLTKPVHEGGLGFNFRWNTGWTSEALDYVSDDPINRRYKHNKLIAPASYAFSENHILAISHDEAVHGKRSLLDKQFGDYETKFASFRTLLAYQMTYPGKKLMFMGSEFAPFREWDYENQLEWFMLGYDMHKKSQLYTAAVNRFYLEEKILWERDLSSGGFEWIYPDMSELNVIAYRRLDKKDNELIVILNFSPVDRDGFTLVQMKHPRYKEVFASDDPEFGGRGRLNSGVLETHMAFDNSRELRIMLPAMSAVILKPVGAVKKSRSKEAKAD